MRKLLTLLLPFRYRRAHIDNETLHIVTEAELAAAFTEWDRRFRQEPERFESESKRLLKSTPETYGAACAPYLLEILNDLRGN